MVSLAEKVDETEEFDEAAVQPSRLDDKTHAEFCLLYRESADSIRFAKAQQWKSLGAVLLLFGGLMVLAWANPEGELYVKCLVIISFLLGAGAIYALVIFQVWQNSEREKIAAMAEHFSGLSQSIRGLRSNREANFFRYILLAFMIASILLGNAVVLFELSKYIVT